MQQRECRLTDGSMNALEAFLQPASPAHIGKNPHSKATLSDLASCGSDVASPCSSCETACMTRVSGSSGQDECCCANDSKTSQQDTGPTEPASVPRRDAASLSYSVFVRDFMVPNLPVIIQVCTSLGTSDLAPICSASPLQKASPVLASRS